MAKHADGHVAVQFLVESLLLATIGGAVGVGLGSLATFAVAFQRGWDLLVPSAAIAAGLGAALVIGTIAGLYPALRAARLSPTDALRSMRRSDARRDRHADQARRPRWSTRADALRGSTSDDVTPLRIAIRAGGESGSRPPLRPIRV